MSRDYVKAALKASSDQVFVFLAVVCSNSDLDIMHN